MEVTKDMRCRNRNCKNNDTFCIEMGINAEFDTRDFRSYNLFGKENDDEEFSEAFYIDTSDALIDCDN